MTNTLDTIGRDNESKDTEIVNVLEALLERDEDITARAVARLHPSIKAASSIIRSEYRLKLLEQYQARQKEFRGWQGRLSKVSKGKAASALPAKKIR